MTNKRTAAATEILANLFIDLDAYTEAMTNDTKKDGKRTAYTHYENVCTRVADLAEMLGTTFGQVLRDKVRIEDELAAAATDYVTATPADYEAAGVLEIDYPGMQVLRNGHDR